MSNKPDELDEILRDSFVGLWTRTPSDNGMDMEFVEVNDEFDVLKDYLKKEILAWAKSKVPKKKDERLNKTGGGKYSPPQLLDIDARGYNQAIDETLKNLEGK